nr:PREDICTED: CD99 antigen-like protein 2 [Apteryx mantelli mantelli]
MIPKCKARTLRESIFPGSLRKSWPDSGTTQRVYSLALGMFLVYITKPAIHAVSEILCVWQPASEFSYEIFDVGMHFQRRGHGDDLGDFNLEDALYDLTTKRPTPKAPRKPAAGTDFDLADFFDTPLETTTKPAKPTAKPYPKKPDNSLWDVVRTTTTKRPKTTRAPPRHNPAKDPMDFDLADAIDKNDGKGGESPNIRPGEDFCRKGLRAELLEGGTQLKPGRWHPSRRGSQHRRISPVSPHLAFFDLCRFWGVVPNFSGIKANHFYFLPSHLTLYCYFLEGLNAEYVKGENMEAVVSEEPQVKYSVLEKQSAEPPKQDSAKL